MYIIFKVIGLTRLEIKPKSTVPEADALTTRPSELLNSRTILPVFPYTRFLNTSRKCVKKALTKNDTMRDASSNPKPISLLLLSCL